jgi:hypothetical protein
MKKIFKSTVSKCFLYTVLCVVLFTSCTEKVVIVEIQKEVMKIDTTYRYTYKIKREDNFFDIEVMSELYKKGDTIKI